MPEIKARKGDRFVMLAWPGVAGEASYPERLVPELLARLHAQGVTEIYADPVERVRPLAPAGMGVTALY